MEDKSLLSTDEISKLLEDLPGWKHQEDLLKKVYLFENYQEINKFLPFFIETVLSQNHHPNFSFDGNAKSFAIEMNTHSAGGKVTQADIDLARALEAWE